MPVLPPGGRLALDGPDGRIGVLRGACGSVRVVAALFPFARRAWGPCGLSRSLFSLRAARLGPLWALAAASFSSCGAPGALVGPGHRFCFLRAARLGPLWALAAAFFHPCGAPGALVGPGRRFCFLRAARLGPLWALAAASVSFARRAWGPSGPWLPLLFVSARRAWRRFGPWPPLAAAFVSLAWRVSGAYGPKRPLSFCASRSATRDLRRNSPALRSRTNNQ